LLKATARNHATLFRKWGNLGADISDFANHGKWRWIHCTWAAPGLFGRQRCRKVRGAKMAEFGVP
jgi:hypothetical protein